MTQRYRGGDPVVGPIELGGQWWMPDTPDRSVGGTLTVRPDGARLELHGTILAVDQLGRVTGDTEYPCVLFGRVGTANVTLCDATPDRRSTSVGEGVVHYETWSSFTTFVGIHAANGLATHFDSYSLSTEQLVNWAPYPDIKHGPDEAGTTTWTVVQPEPIESRVSDGLISLWWGARENLMRTGIDYVVEPVWSYQPDRACDFEDAWDRALSPLLYLTAFATSGSDRITGLRAMVGDGHDRIVVDVYSSNWRDIDLGGRASRWWEYQLPFPYVEGRFEPIVRAWCEHFADHQRRWPLIEYFSMAQTKSMFLEDRFARTCRCVESWHRAVLGGTFMHEDEFKRILDAVSEALPNGADREFIMMRLGFANEPTLRQRIDGMVWECGPRLQELVSEYERFARRVVDTRNSLAHYGHIGDAFTYEELYWAQVTLEAVLKTALLRTLGFDSNEADELLTKSSTWDGLAANSNSLHA